MTGTEPGLSIGSLHLCEGIFTFFLMLIPIEKSASYFEQMWNGGIETLKGYMGIQGPSTLLLIAIIIIIISYCRK